MNNFNNSIFKNFILAINDTLSYQFKKAILSTKRLVVFGKRNRKQHVENSKTLMISITLIFLFLFPLLGKEITGERGLVSS